MVNLITKDNKREAQLNQALETLHFAYRAIIAWPDSILKKNGLNRAHHRVLYFIGRNPDCSIKDLLTIMDISKQYLNKPLKHLITEKFVRTCPDKGDKRIKKLKLTAKGIKLEYVLTEDQRQRFEKAFKATGPAAEFKWFKVMEKLYE